jgi:hypothetical protein
MDAKNGGYSILNKGISMIDFKGTTEITRKDGGYKCICRNRTVTRGFYESNEVGKYLDGSDLLCCNFCGRIFNKNTLEIVRGVHIR